MCTSEVCDHVPLCCSSLSGMDYSCHSFSGEKGARERERGKGGLLASASPLADWLKLVPLIGEQVWLEGEGR